jgi:predicted ribosome quality control (RQC) complex YloA/Tae2 family protein
MQPVDYTTVIALYTELQQDWIPARLEQVYQRNRYEIAIALRNLQKRRWLTLSWHPQAARVCFGDPPPRTPDTFTFSDQLRHQLGGLALIAIEPIAPWERVLDFRFARRPGDPILWHLYGEIMGKYSNVILTDANNEVVTAAQQVSPSKSSVRPIQTGQSYSPPPSLTGTIPTLSEPQERWQERISLVPGKLIRQMLQVYRGLSPTLLRQMARTAGLNPNQKTDTLEPEDWDNLFKYWQEWLKRLENKNFDCGWTAEGYTVTGWEMTQPEDLQVLLNRYYTNQLNQQIFGQLHHQLSQKIKNILQKLEQKAKTFQERLDQSEAAEKYRQEGDLLMAYLHEWQPGMTEITLNDFETGEPVKIPLNPEKNAVQNAQYLYKQHQKLKRARTIVEPLRQATQAEIDYLEQVRAALNQIDHYETPEDLQALMEVRDELIAQGYLESPRAGAANPETESQPYRYQTPSGFELWVGRNNRQNDQLTFRTATDYDLWFHTQEIPGSHVLLRLEPGAVPDQADLQFAANMAAYYSRAQESDQAPVVYTEPKKVYKPKGAKPGMAIYTHEQVIWGYPQQVKAIVS